MSDNALAPGVGLTFATDEIAGTPNVHWPYSKVAWGAPDTATPVQAGSGLPVVADSYARIIAGSTIARLANTTAYATGQIIGGSATVASALNIMTFSGVSRTAGGVVRIERARLYKSNVSALGLFQLVLFRASPTLAAADAGALAGNVAVGNASSATRIVGRINFDMTGAMVGSDGAEVAGLPISGSGILCSPSGSAVDLYGVLIATGAYTPTSAETLSIVLELFAF